jgi:hypothetical protein
MAEAGVVRRVVLPVVLLGLTAAGLLNTYGDSTGVEKLAGETACGGQMCPVQMTEFTRSPLAQEYVFVVGKGTQRVTVKCAREWLFVGDYKCEKK